MSVTSLRQILNGGVAIPAHPLALTSDRTLDERRQRALTRYYAAAGAGGIAVGVHTTQFAIRDPKIGLFKPVLDLAREEMDRADANRNAPLLRIGGVVGTTGQAVLEALTLRDTGYHAALVSLAALKDADDEFLVRHCAKISDVLPVFGFYLQPAVGGRVLPYSFWRRFCEIENVWAVKIAPFNRYQTLDVVRAVVDSGREDIALYTGNDDNIVADLLTPFRFMRGGVLVERRIVGGLLGQWAVWTSAAVRLLERCKNATPEDMPALLALNAQLTDANAAVFDAANGFHGCIAGIHEILRRQGLLEGLWCLDPGESLSPGQAEELDRVIAAYPDLTDDEFVAQHRDDWLKG